jgi:hypothetical protein
LGGAQEAVAAKIEEQIKFVAWWDANVQDAGGDRQSPEALLQPRNDAFSVEEATDLTGMTKYRVSRLNAALEKLDPYRQLSARPAISAHLREGDARTLLNNGERA